MVGGSAPRRRADGRGDLPRPRHQSARGPLGGVVGGIWPPQPDGVTRQGQGEWEEEKTAPSVEDLAALGNDACRHGDRDGAAQQQGQQAGIPPQDLAITPPPPIQGEHPQRRHHHHHRQRRSRAAAGCPEAVWAFPPSP